MLLSPGTPRSERSKWPGHFVRDRGVKTPDRRGLPQSVPVEEFVEGTEPALLDPLCTTRCSERQCGVRTEYVVRRCWRMPSIGRARLSSTPPANANQAFRPSRWNPQGALRFELWILR